MIFLPLPQGERKRRSKRLQQPVQIIALLLRPVHLGGAAAQLFQNLPCAGQIGGTRNLDAGIAQRRGAAPQRVLAPTRLLARALLSLVGQCLGALAQGIQGLVLGTAGIGEVLLAQRALGIAHRLAGFAQLLRRFAVHALQRILEFLFQVVLLFLQTLGAALLGIGLTLLLAEGF